MIEELVLAGDLPAATISRMERRGELRRLARGVYTTAEDPERFVRANLHAIAGRLFPGAVVTDRSALTGGLVDGHLYLSGVTPDRIIELPGATLQVRQGVGPLTGDVLLPDGLYLASRGRALLENMRPTRSRGGKQRATLTPKEFDDWIDRLCRTDGEERLNRHRDQAADVAEQLGADLSDVHHLSQRIGAALGSRTAKTQSPSLAARLRGKPYDSERTTRFDVLATALRGSPPQHHYRDDRDPERYRYAPFYDAYFSNFVEGTEFAVAEAVTIVFDGVVPNQRTADAHDVAGTYQILQEIQDGAPLPQSGDEFVRCLIERHAILMGGRPDKNPGQFKLLRNQAGGTLFVAPDLVEGTLREGFKRIQDLSTPFERAVMSMWVVAEVHPFDDGNGRMARVMMNAELEAGDETRIIIPTVYRDDYLGALRRLSRQDDPFPIIRALTYAHDVMARLDFRDLRDAERHLTAINAFEADTDRRLLMPSDNRSAS